VTDEDLRALIFFAWNLKPEQIVIDDETAHYIRKQAKYLSDKFGGSDDLPIVYSEDFRKSMARLSVAMAVIDLATTDDFSQVIVNLEHVSDACLLMERIYEARNCKLDRYAKAYVLTHGTAGIDEIITGIDAILSGDIDMKRRFHHIMQQLLRCNLGERIRKSDLVDEFDLRDGKTIQRNMQFFLHHHLVAPNTQRGYSPEPKLFQIVDRLERIDPIKYDFEKSWREVYPMGESSRKSNKSEMLY
jgi:hypothetical protein